jgi:hypothetical protein
VAAQRAREPAIKLFYLAQLGEELRRRVHRETGHVGRFITDADVRITACAAPGALDAENGW